MTFDLVYADPPWRYDIPAPRHGDTIEAHYSTMPTEAICALRPAVSKNAVLYLWVTAPKVPDGLAVMRAWGFEYKSCAVWDKGSSGLGYWWRQQHELLFVGTRGKFSPPPAALRLASVIRCKRGKHSEKPWRVRDWLAEAFPDARKLEMFARFEDEMFRPEGWYLWGNQA